MLNSYAIELPSEYEITNKITSFLSKQDVVLELEYTISVLNKYIKIDRNECQAIYPKYQKIVDNFNSIDEFEKEISELEDKLVKLKGGLEARNIDSLKKS